MPSINKRFFFLASTHIFIQIVIEPAMASSPNTSLVSCVSFRSGGCSPSNSTNGHEDVKTKTNKDESYEMEAVSCATLPCNSQQVDMKLVDELTERMMTKVKDAMLDGKFSVKETAGLTLSVCSAVSALFPSMRGACKKEIAVTVLHTVVRSLMLMGILAPEFGVALSIIPNLIDTVIYISGGIENLWKKVIPEFLAWLRKIVWGDNPDIIENQHVERVVAALDVTSASGLASQV